MSKDMEYPEEFVNRVKEKIPDLPQLHKALDSGSTTVGHYLEISGESIAPAIILSMLKHGKVSELNALAEQHMYAQALYAEWLDLFRSQIKQHTD